MVRIKINFKIIKSIAPGIPKIPTTSDVIIFKPMWKPKFAPTKFIMYIIAPPIIVLSTNFNIFFRISTIFYNVFQVLHHI